MFLIPAPVINMDILTCFRIVPDFSSAIDSDWEQPALEADSRFARVFDCYDEAALETALRLRDDFAAAGEVAQLRALTLCAPGMPGTMNGGRTGKTSAVSAAGGDRLIEKLFSLGFERVTRLECDTGELCPPNNKAAVIAGYIRETGLPGLILCGIRGGIGGSKMTGPMIAEHLGLPCVGDVCDAHRASGNALYVETSGEGARSAGKIFGKAVLLIGNTERGLLRIPTLKARSAVRGKRVETVAVPAPVTCAAPTPDSLRRQLTARGKCSFIEGDIAEKAEAVLAIWKGGGI